LPKLLTAKIAKKNGVEIVKLPTNYFLRFHLSGAVHLARKNICDKLNLKAD
jgi:hypothetical protein